MTGMERAKKWARWLWRPADTLSQKVIKSGFWVVAFRIAGRSGTLIRTLALARILAPSDFGLMGIALLAMSILETLSQIGFYDALIQRKEGSEDYLDTAWTVSAIRGLVLFVILYFAAPYIGLFFNASAAIPILRVIGISTLLNGLTNIGVIYFRKELEFNKQFVYRASGTITDLIIAVVAGLLLRSVWALVLGLLARSLVQVVMSYVMHDYRPRLCFEKQEARELFNFGQWVLGSSIVTFLLRQGDHVLVGKILNVASLGFYQMAFQISIAPATEIANLICQVALPTYSKVQDRVEELKQLYYMILQIVASLSVPLAGGIFVLAEEFTQLFLGEQWLPMASALRVLSLFGATSAVNITMGTLFHGSGRPAIGTKGRAWQFILLAVLIYPLVSRWGIVGAGCATMIAEFFFLLYGMLNVSTLVGCTLGELSKPLLVSALCSTVMILTIGGLKPALVNRLPDIFAFIVLVFFGGAVYLISIAVFDRLFACHLGETLGYLKAKIEDIR